MTSVESERPDERHPLALNAFSLPNVLTYLRVLAIPAVLVLMSRDSRQNAFWGAMVFALASVTDAVDGWVARRFNLGSMLGKFLDPLADKLLVLGVLLMLLDLGRVPVWVALVLLAREMVVTGLRGVAGAMGLVIAARDLGKKKTAFQMVGLWALVVHHPYRIDFFSEPIDFHRIGMVFLYISLGYSLVSAWDYFAGFARALKVSRRS